MRWRPFTGETPPVPDSTYVQVMMANGNISTKRGVPAMFFDWGSNLKDETIVAYMVISDDPEN